jgi:DNA modification methylase
VLEELLAGQKVECVVTDPPYGVDYKGTANPSTVRAPKDIAGDGLASLVLEELLVGALALACDRAIAGAPIYVWFSHSQEPTFRAAFSTAGWRYAQTLIWAKNHMVLGRADYQWRHEPVLYGWKPGATHRWFGDHSETTLLDDDVDIRDLSKSQLIRLVGQMRTRENGDVLTAAKPSASELHPTQKPVWLLEHFMWNSTERDNVVLDPFAGSGSTLIAAEQTRRKAAIVEIDPAYCDVIRDRFDRLDRG